MSIRNSSKVSIRGKARLNNVRGNQINHSKTIITNVVGRATEQDEYDEFEYVKRGRIVTIKEIHSRELEEREWEPRGEGHWVAGRILRKTKRRICAIELQPDRLSSQTHKFTAFIYEDDDAHSFWEDVFQEFSRNWITGSLQLFGLNRSKIPMLIFHHELIPLEHSYKSTFWGDIYLAYLSRSKDCSPFCLWMDSTGALYRGPIGPIPYRSFTPAQETIIVPSSREMLESDASFRFLSKFKSEALNEYVLEWARWQWEAIHLNDLLPDVAGDLSSEDCHRFEWKTEYPYLEHVWKDTGRQFPMDLVGDLCFDTVYSPTRGAVARSPYINGQWMLWNMYPGGGGVGIGGSVSEILFIDELTCFKLKACPDFFSFLTWCKFEAKESTLKLEFCFESIEFERDWISQVPRFSDTLKMSETEERFFTIQPPSPGLRISQASRQYDGLAAFFRLCDAKELHLIYLFLYPPPMCISELKHWLDGDIPTHFWSLDETGQSQMTDDELEEWGIPNFEPCLSPTYPDDSLRIMRLHSLPPHICKALRDWQIVQGYDPSTADYAQYMDCPEYEIVDEPWAELGKTSESYQEEDQGWSSSLSPLSSMPIHTCIVEEENENEPAHESTWWEAIPGSGISAFGF
ncbi:hypothetical protein VNI00_013094 [Paramarasmius palmivorus]|uniref:Uncharacterized protein n=1 Tax=Paramarasmius palmivorus TaxID=297713 RepID=A0AAW0BYK0_9AGAR